MQDRFSFRVWHTTTKKMHLVWGFTPFNIVLNSIATDNITLKRSECVLMQCTGLKDKNDKLIYEGDIVKSDFGFVTNTINPLIFNIGNVIYSDYIAGFVIASDINDYSPYKTSFFGKTEALNCIVIGNIYENPDLLEV